MFIIMYLHCIINLIDGRMHSHCIKQELYMMIHTGCFCLASNQERPSSRKSRKSKPISACSAYIILKLKYCFDDENEDNERGSARLGATQQFKNCLHSAKSNSIPFSKFIFVFAQINDEDPEGDSTLLM